MGRKKQINKNDEKMGVLDILAFAKANWTPSDVNQILDRIEMVGYINNSTGDDESDENDENLDESEVEDIEDEDLDESDENENNINADIKEDGSKESNTIQDENKNALLENENQRLKKELSNLKAKNRNKDVSGMTSNKTPAQSLIDAFQSIF